MSNWVKSNLTLETALYGLAFLLALIFRFLSLGIAPLGDHEAHLALQALGLANGERLLLDSQPGYLAFTSAWFFLFGHDNGLARFWPALAGACLVFAPALFKQRIGRQAALVLAFLLAFDPGLVAISRQADGRILATVALIFALGFFLARQAVGTGIFIGLSVLGGPVVWFGALMVGLGWFVTRLFQPPTREDYADSRMGVFDHPESQPIPAWDWKKVAGWVLGTLLVVGTLCFTQPAILSAAAGSLGDFFTGVVRQGVGQPIQLILVTWLISNPLAFLLAIVEMVQARRRRDNLGLFLSWWWVISMLLVLVYPAHQVADLALPALPMLALAARSAVRIYSFKGEKAIFFAQAAISLVLTVSMSMSLVGAANAIYDDELGLRLAAVLASLFLLLATTFLVVWGWGLRVAGRGLRLGITLVLIAFTLATAWKAAGLSNLPEMETWRLDAYPKGADLVRISANDASMWKTGRTDNLDVMVSGLNNPSLFWELRKFKSVTSGSGVSANQTPSILITPKMEQMAGNGSYSGQVIAWTTSPNWSTMSAKQWCKWLVFREAPLKQQDIQLWVRTDLFPGGTSTR